MSDRPAPTSPDADTQTRGTGRRPRRLGWAYFVITALFTVAAFAPGRGSVAQDATTPPEAADTQGEVVHVRVGEIKAAEPAAIQKRFDSLLKPINSALLTTLFVDISFGAFSEVETDDQGNTVYADEPIYTVAKAEFVAELVDAEGRPIPTAGGGPYLVVVAQGAEYQAIGPDGKPLVKPTDKPKVIERKVPLVVAWLGLGAVFFTIYHGFAIWRCFGHSIAVIRGKFSTGREAGEIPPFRALTSALSATVGLGNIAGVALAMGAGGPGALFWMMFLGFFGMASKFHESSLSQMFRQVDRDTGEVSGGPMYVLDQGFRKHLPALWPLGKVLAILFALLCIFASLAGGNMFQANQSFEGFFSIFVLPTLSGAEQIESSKGLASVGYGILMATIVGIVVLGGITRIGAATSRLVPGMALIYVAACLTILFENAGQIPALVGLIFTNAFTPEAGFGGLIGAMMIGFQRAAFSSEAGVGSSAIAHSAAQTDEPVREGFVASLEPFIDTVVICFMTGMVILITNAHNEADGGTARTLYAFQKESVFSGVFPYILAVSIVLFAFSTMISWCYYGERAANYLLGKKAVFGFRIAFVISVFIGSVASLGAVVDFADATLLSMALPNILGGILMAGIVRKATKGYLARLKSGEMAAAIEMARKAPIPPPTTMTAMPTDMVDTPPPDSEDAG
ncbi:MAG: alanine/glycine:cation symporter family protein [Planctomycetota bacterium]